VLPLPMPPSQRPSPCGRYRGCRASRSTASRVAPALRRRRKSRSCRRREAALAGRRSPSSRKVGRRPRERSARRRSHDGTASGSLLSRRSRSANGRSPRCECAPSRVDKREGLRVERLFARKRRSVFEYVRQLVEERFGEDPLRLTIPCSRVRKTGQLCQSRRFISPSNSRAGTSRCLPALPGRPPCPPACRSGDPWGDVACIRLGAIHRRDLVRHRGIPLR
jgi:hypothetical protein